MVKVVLVRNDFRTPGRPLPENSPRSWAASYSSASRILTWDSICRAWACAIQAQCAVTVRCRIEGRASLRHRTIRSKAASMATPAVHALLLKFTMEVKLTDKVEVAAKMMGRHIATSAVPTDQAVTLPGGGDNT